MLRTRPWQVVLVAVVLVAAVAFAVPNLFGRASLDGYPSWLPSSQVNLGLDLQGGSHLLLEVQVGDILRERITTLVGDTRVALRRAGVKYTGLKAARDRVVFQLIDPGQIDAADDAVEDLDPEAEIDSDSSGGFRIVLSEDAVEARRVAAVSQSIEIIRRRIDETGVREPTIQRQGEDRILVQLPGLDDPERVKRLLGKTAKLTFHLLDENVTAEDRRSGRTPRGAQRLPSDELDANGEEVFYIIRKRVMVSGDELVDAATTRDQTGQWAVSFRFDSSGARKFGEVTTENVGKPFAIVLDGRVISAPVIREPIVGGTGQITGNFTVEEANDLSLLLRAGALPAPMKILEERTVGPDLGADSIEAGKIACIIGLAAVILFMALYYGLFGLVADLALILNLIIMLGVLSLLQATLTLPGIAGIVLTIGMAVDANVLIFERIPGGALRPGAPACVAAVGRDLSLAGHDASFPMDRNEPSWPPALRPASGPWCGVNGAIFLFSLNRRALAPLAWLSRLAARRRGCAGRAAARPDPAQLSRPVGRRARCLLISLRRRALVFHFPQAPGARSARLAFAPCGAPARSRRPGRCAARSRSAPAPRVLPGARGAEPCRLPFRAPARKGSGMGGVRWVGESRSGGLGRALFGRGRGVVACRSLRPGPGVRRRLLLSAARPLRGLDPLLWLGLLRLRLALRALLLPLLVPAIGGDHAIVVLGVLEEIFGADPVSGRERVLRQGLILLDDLEGGSADLSLGAVALEGRSAPVESGTPSVASVPAWAFAVWTLHTDRLLTSRAAKHRVPAALVTVTLVSIFR